MSDYKILLTTHSTAFLTSGGGESELVQVAEMMSDAGVQADIYGIGSRSLRFYDAVMHFSLNADGEAMIRATVEHGARLFLWPNVWWLTPPSAAEIERIRRLIGLADRLLFKSKTELDHFARHVPIDGVRCAVVAPGVSDRFLHPADLDLLPTVCDVTDYVVCLGLIEPVKNQLALIRALNGLGLRGLMVGGYRDEAYYRRCLAEAKPGTHFLPFIQPCSALLRSALANATLLAEPSFDPPGRSCLEGALMSKPMVMLDGAWQREHFGGNAWYSTSGEAEDIAAAIQAALTDADRDEKIKVNHAEVYARHSAATVSTDLIKILFDAEYVHE